MLDIRIDPDDFDAEWVTDALEGAGVARGATVTGLDFAGFVGTGQMSRNGRFRLEWSDPEGRPSTLVAKFPSGDPTVRSWSFQTGAYGNEHTFYSHVAATVDIRTPQCWVTRYDQAAERCVLLMEDLAHSVQGDQFAGCSADQVALVVEQAVALHAPRWGDPSLEALHLGRDDPDAPQRLADFYQAALGLVLERLGAGLSDEVIGLAEGFAEVIARWTLGTGVPRTIVHGDFRPDNFLFATAPDAPPVVVVDWQTVGRGGGATDVAYLLGGAFPEDRRRALERSLVDEYRSRLGAKGIDYSAADCWRDYRWGTLHGVLIGVLATMMAAHTERGDRLFTLMISRHARHALDLDALGLVGQGG